VTTVTKLTFGIGLQVDGTRTRGPAGCPLCGRSGLMRRSKQHRLLDDLVRQRAQLIRHGQSECLGGLHVDHQLELDWSLDRKLARLLA